MRMRSNLHYKLCLRSFFRFCFFPLADLEELSRYLPELTEKIPLPNIASVIDFFQTRSVEQQQLQQQDDGSGGGKDDASVRSKDGATSSSDNAAEQQSGGKESDKYVAGSV